MFDCCSEGSVSLVALVPAGLVAEPTPAMLDGDPVLVHLTACPRHARGAREWLQARSQDPVWTLGTEYLMAHWDQVIEPIELPVLGSLAMAV